MLSSNHDILVTTPINQIKHAAREAAACIKHGGGYYFRKFARLPKLLRTGETKIFYVEDGYIRGFGVVTNTAWRGYMTDEVSGEEWGAGYYIAIPADTWTWIRPIPHKGFQGFRYWAGQKYEIVGNWLDPMPEAEG